MSSRDEIFLRAGWLAWLLVGCAIAAIICLISGFFCLMSRYFDVTSSALMLSDRTIVIAAMMIVSMTYPFLDYARDELTRPDRMINIQVKIKGSKTNFAQLLQKRIRPF